MNNTSTELEATKVHRSVILVILRRTNKNSKASLSFNCLWIFIIFTSVFINYKHNDNRQIETLYKQGSKLFLEKP